jgi:hypothetical protein
MKIEITSHLHFVERRIAGEHVVTTANNSAQHCCHMVDGNPDKPAMAGNRAKQPLRDTMQTLYIRSFSILCHTSPAL